MSAVNQVLVVYSTCVTVALAVTLLRKNRSVGRESSRGKQPLFDQNVRTDDKALVERYVAVHPDFPKKGIVFRDIFPVFRSPAATEAIMRLLLARIKQLGRIDMVIGLESRGFLFGPTLAMELDCGFAPIRKPGKLPGQVISASYEKEYGKDTFEMQSDAVSPGDRVLIVDDLLATGGSLSATVQLVEAMKAQVIECVVVIELTELKGKDNVKAPVWSLLQY